MKLIDYAVTITGKTSKNTYRYEAKKIGGGTTKRTRSLIIDRLVTDDGRPDLSFYTNFCTDKTPDEAQCDDTGASKLRFISRTGKLIPGEDLEISFGVRGSNDTDGISAPLPDIKTAMARIQVILIRQRQSSSAAGICRTLTLLHRI